MLETYEPMLAHTWEDKQRYVSYPLFLQPKLNGMRCEAVESGLWSRTGKKILSVPELEVQVKQYFPDLALDGELYSHNTPFEDIMSTARRTVNIIENREVLYWVYDVCGEGSFEDRWMRITNRFLRLPAGVYRFLKVPTKLCLNYADVERWYQYYLSKGFEGVILRHKDAPYEAGKRSPYLLKLKPWHDLEVEVLDFKGGTGRNFGAVGSLVCRFNDAEGVERLISVHSGLSNTTLDEISANPNAYVGKKLTIKFQEMTKGGIPRFPSFLHWRDAE